MTTILVCGGRDYLGYNLLKTTLEDLMNEIWLENDDDEVITIIAGEATGADFLAKVFYFDEWSDSDNVKYRGFPADWKQYGKAAGSIRNQQMLDEGKPTLVVAFPGGRGTADMVRRAEKTGIKVILVEEEI